MLSLMSLSFMLYKVIVWQTAHFSTFQNLRIPWMKSSVMTKKGGIEIFVIYIAKHIKRESVVFL